MSFDIQQLKPKHSRRIPRERPLVLASIDLAASILEANNCSGGATMRFAEELRRVAELYYKVADLDALRPVVKGRPLNRADISFIYAMASVLKSLFPLRSITFRRYRAARRGEIGGTEEATRFQMICNDWMSFVDPERAKPLQAAAFKQARDRCMQRRVIH